MSLVAVVHRAKVVEVFLFGLARRCVWKAISCGRSAGLERVRSLAYADHRLGETG